MLFSSFKYTLEQSKGQYMTHQMGYLTDVV